MSSSHENPGDTRHSLLKISSRHSKTISHLIDIQSSQMEQEKSLEFIKNLECLYFWKSHKHHQRWSESKKKPLLRRQRINAFNETRYVALSYTWDPSPQEQDIQSGGYVVQPSSANQPQPSSVRNGVFKRARRYMDYVNSKYLWIDQHCIEQREGRAKETGMQAMDLVYSLSKYPVALLSRPIRSSDELRLLVQILKGRLARECFGGFELSAGTSLERALRAMQLLKDIISDLWWSRGWTYQENYRASTRMTLLIPHPRSLDYEVLQVPDFLLGTLRGELCIKSVNFHEEATKLCLAYQSQRPLNTLCKSVLERAGKYTVLLQTQDADGNKLSPESMSPTIISDITNRQLTQVWDYLSIIANCCQYSVRLDSIDLREKGHSLNLSILALYLLNGEILSNDPDNRVDVLSARTSNIAKYLQMQSFKGLASPFLDKGLTFNKSCRFINARLTRKGIQTKGHLWRLDKLIFSRSFPGRLPYEQDSEHGLERRVRRRLRQLVNELDDSGCKSLSEQLDQFLQEDYKSSTNRTFAKNWKDLMARTIVDAIDDGKILCAASLMNQRQRYKDGGAIFILEGVGDNGTSENSDGSQSHGWAFKERVFVFTSSQPRRERTETSDSNDIDRHVSLIVDSPDLRVRPYSPKMPRLFTKRWIHGLCFFDGYPRRRVVFPWPTSLRGL
ncbi:heterokaryon incompatibility protein-domain-containing protein [Xylogone sp. PMI_703]|nr:heterokaryon incompatibility protein-domain-containing protein [Xylogone sp. PMI_703]